MNRARRSWKIGFLVVVGLLCGVSSMVRAEFYIAGEAGYTFPQDLSDVKGTGSLSGISIESLRLSDIELQNSLMYGGKLGYFFSNARWFGIELEAFNTTPHIKQQTVILSGPGGSVNLGVQPGSHFRVLTTAFNAILRIPGERVEPYIGAGLGIFFARASDATGSDSDNGRPGVNVLGGLRFFFTRQVALFAEYKFNHATFKFDNAFASGAGFEADYNAHHAAGGLSFHFR